MNSLAFDEKLNTERSEYLNTSKVFSKIQFLTKRHFVSTTKSNRLVLGYVIIGILYILLKNNATCYEIQVACSEILPFSPLLITFPCILILLSTYFDG